MLFNSFEFAIFLPLVFSLYWFVFRKLNQQNFFLIAASYVFYGWWDWRFLFLIILSSGTDFIVGKKIFYSKSQKSRKILLYSSLCVNLGILGFFKYFNFFIDAFVEAFASLGINVGSSTLNIVLPVGISFYTFQTLSYTLDIYRKKLKPTEDIIAFFAFVSFFPQLVAGPIERAKNLLPQFRKARIFNYEKAKDGLRQILWGLFKKMVIADTLGIHVDYIFSHITSSSGSLLFLGVIYFAFQIYCDFSGYSDIAIGVAKLFGFDLMKNFSLPYFSRNIKEFWSRWHISLSTWFRDYVYIPLGGNRNNKLKQTRNSLITFTSSGLWHGANWTFLFWGFLNGLYYVPSIFFARQKYVRIVAESKFFPELREMAKMLFTFNLILFSWIFFRAQSLHESFAYIDGIISYSLFTIPVRSKKEIIWVIIFIVIEWLQRKRQHTLQISDLHVSLRWIIYLILVFTILNFGAYRAQEFIYFQF